MISLEQIKKRRAVILRIAKNHGAQNVRIFGSASREEADSGSDIDILVDMDSDRNLLDLVALERELKEALECDVDVVVDGGISPYLKDKIHSEATPI